MVFFINTLVLILKYLISSIINFIVPKVDSITKPFINFKNNLYLLNILIRYWQCDNKTKTISE